MHMDKGWDDTSRAVQAGQMGNKILFLLLTFLTPGCMLVQSETCSMEASVEDKNEAASTEEEDGSEAGAATTAT